MQEKIQNYLADFGLRQFLFVILIGVTAIANISMIRIELSYLPNGKEVYRLFTWCLGFSLAVFVILLPSLRATVFTKLQAQISIFFTVVLVGVRVGMVYLLWFENPNTVRFSEFVGMESMIFVLLVFEIVVGWVGKGGNPLQPSLEEAEKERDEYSQKYRDEELAHNKLKNTVRSKDKEITDLTKTNEELTSTVNATQKIRTVAPRLYQTLLPYIYAKAVVVEGGKKSKACLCGCTITGSGRTETFTCNNCGSQWSDKFQSWVKVGVDLIFPPQREEQTDHITLGGLRLELSESGKTRSLEELS